MTQLINVTPHVLRIRMNSDNRVAEPDMSDIVLEPSGAIARVSSINAVVDEINGIPVVKAEFGEIFGLPDPADDIIYVASMLAAQKAALDGRTDVISPNTAPKQDIRYPDGHPQKGLTFAVLGFQRFF